MTTMGPISADDALALVEHIHPKYRAVWQNQPPHAQAALARYFLTHRPAKLEKLSPTRPRMLKWYCPFADQQDFASGHRYCLNVFVGCSHRCEYCYASSYQPTQQHHKKNFKRQLDSDLEDLDRFDVPPAPVHLSNSTDPFQRELEISTRNTRFALERILAYRHRFTSIVLLTKNPSLAARDEYVDLLRELSRLPSNHNATSKLGSRPALLVEVSLAFWDDRARAAFEPGAPTVADRIAGLEALSRAGVAVALRVDPLFPRNLAQFGLIEAQPLDDLRQLVHLGKRLGVQHIISSPLKIVIPRRQGGLSPIMRTMREAYLAMSPRLVFRGGSYRLPDPTIVSSAFHDICKSGDVMHSHCRHNLLTTP